MSSNTRNSCRSLNAKDKPCPGKRVPFSRYCLQHQDPSAWIIGFILSAIVSFIIYGVSWRDNYVKEKHSRPSGNIKGLLKSKNIKTVAIKLGEEGFFTKFPDITTGGRSVFEGFRIWIEDGEIKMTAIIRDSAGNILAQIHGTEWQVNPSKTLDRNFDDRGVEILNEKGEVILQTDIGDLITLPDTKEQAVIVTFKGIFSGSSGWRWVLGSPFPKDQTKNGLLPIVEAISPKFTNDRVHIEKIFKYPSGQHQGERVHPD